MPDFITSYGVEIILSIVSIIFGVFVGYIFYRLQKRDVVSAQDERIKRATEELIDVIEGFAINKQSLSKEAILNLMAASERAHRVELITVCTPTSLLQDVALRLQKSRHLDITQKAEYVDQITKLISQVSRELPETPTNIKANLDLLVKVETALHNDDKQGTLDSIHNLKESLERLEVPSEQRDYPRTSSLTEILAIGLMAVIVSFLTLSDYFNLNSLSTFLLGYLAIILLLTSFIFGTPAGKRVLSRFITRLRK